MEMGPFLRPLIGRHFFLSFDLSYLTNTEEHHNGPVVLRLSEARLSCFLRPAACAKLSWHISALTPWCGSSHPAGPS
jgi:hypothetical protein